MESIVFLLLPAILTGDIATDDKCDTSDFIIPACTDVDES